MRVPPEVQLARTLVEQRGLTPPLDIVALASAFAEVRHIEFPPDLNHDGVCLNAKRRGRTRILINTVARSQRRMRFTLAHELGHALIPWHTGTIVDEADPSAGQANAAYWEMELEANRFASELLMPAAFVAGIVATADGPLDMVRRIVRGAEVSYQAAVIRLVPMLPRGYVYALLDGQGDVVFGAKSPRTAAEAPFKGQRIPDVAARYRWSAMPWTETRSGVTHVWWHSTGITDLPAVEAGATWRGLLNDMVGQIGLDEVGGKKLKSSVNAIVANVNSGLRGGERSAEALYHGCLQRFEREADQPTALGDLVALPDFQAFLSLKVRELAGG